MTAAVNEAVIQFTEAKIELYEIIEVKICNFLLLQSNLNFWPQLSVIQVMSVLSREHLTGEVEMRDVATLMELMTKTISSARYLPLDRQSSFFIVEVEICICCAGVWWSSSK